jgi:hypothetical protein
MPGLDGKVVCATNLIIMGDMIPHVYESNPLRMVREVFGLSQEELASLANYAARMELLVHSDIYSEERIKTFIVGVESGLIREPERRLKWDAVSRVLRKGRLNIPNLVSQFKEWNERLDKCLAKETRNYIKLGAWTGPQE